MNFGINLSFAVKRWVEPYVWAKMVREDMKLDTVQFTFDLLDPWFPSHLRKNLTAEVRKAADEYGITIDSAFSGLAYYTFNGFLHPDPSGRKITFEWWMRAMDVALEIGTENIGGPLGGMSIKDASSADRRDSLYKELLESMGKLTEEAARAGIKQFLVESTPLEREVPYSIEQSLRFMEDLKSYVCIPVKLLIDVGHALYQPLYGQDASMKDWVRSLKSHIGAFHLQNTDFLSDSHWGWPDARGKYDPADLASLLHENGLQETPCFLEVVYAFELDDNSVRQNILSSVDYCRERFY